MKKTFDQTIVIEIGDFVWSSEDDWHWWYDGSDQLLHFKMIVILRSFIVRAIVIFTLTFQASFRFTYTHFDANTSQKKKNSKCGKEIRIWLGLTGTKGKFLPMIVAILNHILFNFGIHGHIQVESANISRTSIHSPKSWINWILPCNAVSDLISFVHFNIQTKMHLCS